MKQFLFILITLFLSLPVLFAQKVETGNFTIVIHGGAGTILKKNMTPELEKMYTDKMSEALEAGYDTLEKGGTSVSAVEVAIRILEDSPLFNAGKGSVFTSDGKNEMDASIMDGKTLMAGSVAGVRTIKNPITAAKTVMEKSPHVMMTGRGAEQFAGENGLEIVDTSYFYDEKRWKQLMKAKEEEEKQKLDPDTTGYYQAFQTDYKFGTVGAVALDIYGNIAAGTSTGGMTNKRFGRVGDSPVIGAGTYADNNSCAVSCTGHGEYFIRAAVAHDISALVQYKGYTVEQAANEVVMKKLVKLGGEGGVIVLDAKGNFAMVFNTEGMYRGYMKKNGKPVALIYK